MSRLDMVSAQIRTHNYLHCLEICTQIRYTIHLTQLGSKDFWGTRKRNELVEIGKAHPPCRAIRGALRMSQWMLRLEASTVP